MPLLPSMPIVESNCLHQISNGLVPVVIGVTGHRDIPASDVEVLKNTTRRVLAGFEDSSPDSPHVLLTALAEGADRIAAHVALERGWILGVILPAQVALYEHDFETVESKAEFHELLGKAGWVEELHAESMTPAVYRAVGLKICRMSLFLLAYWDGQQKIVEGGTADIVNVFLSGIPESNIALNAENFLLDARPVWHVLTRRMCNPERGLITDVGKLDKLSPSPEGFAISNELARWDAVLENINLYNLDASECFRDEAKLAESLSYLDPKFKQSGWSEANEAVARIYCVSDVISQKTQAKRNRQFWAILALATTAIVAEQVYSGPYSNPMILVFSIIAGMCAWVVFAKGRRQRLENRYLEYRSLAEVCRVQYFWHKAGMQASAVDYFLRDQRDEMEWIRRAVSTAQLLPRRLHPSIEGMRSVSTAWLIDQQKYFIGVDGEKGRDKARHNQARHEKWSRISGRLFKLGLLFTVFVALIHIWLDISSIELPDWVISSAPLLYGLLFAAAGLASVYQEVMAFSEQSNRYRQMGMAMAVASNRLGRSLEVGDLCRAEKILLAVGRGALEENGSWLLLHRERPVEVPLG